MARFFADTRKRVPFVTGIGRYPDHEFDVEPGACKNCGRRGDLTEVEVVGNAKVTYDAAQPISDEWNLCLATCLPALRAMDWGTLTALAARRTRPTRNLPNCPECNASSFVLPEGETVGAFECTACSVHFGGSHYDGYA
jgi:hypothetical protein